MYITPDKYYSLFTITAYFIALINIKYTYMDVSDKMIKLGELSIDDYINGHSIHIIDVNLPIELSKFFLEKVCRIEMLGKMYRNCIMVEYYEGIPELEAEINRRGYLCSIKNNILTLTPN